MTHAAAGLLGAALGAAAMAAFGWWFELAPVTPRVHRTAPRPAWAAPAPVPADDPLGRIPPQQLPTR